MQLKVKRFMGLIIEKLKYETAERGRNQYC